MARNPLSGGSLISGLVHSFITLAGLSSIRVAMAQDLSCFSPPLRPTSALANTPEVSRFADFGATPMAQEKRPASRAASLVRPLSRNRDLDTENDEPSVLLLSQSPPKRSRSATDMFLLHSTAGRISPSLMGEHSIGRRSPSVLGPPGTAMLIGRKSPILATLALGGATGPMSPMHFRQRRFDVSSSIKAPAPATPAAAPSAHNGAVPSVPECPDRDQAEPALRVDPSRPRPRLFDDDDDESGVGDAQRQARGPHVVSRRLARCGYAMVGLAFPKEEEEREHCRSRSASPAAEDRALSPPPLF